MKPPPSAPKRRSSRRKAGPPAKTSNGKGTRRSFTAQQKQDGADLGRRIGAAAAAAQMDVHPTMLRNWMKKFPASETSSTEDLPVEGLRCTEPGCGEPIPIAAGNRYRPDMVERAIRRHASSGTCKAV